MKLRKSAQNYFTSAFALSLLLSLTSTRLIPAASASEQQLADDTLLVLLALHANRSNVRASLLSEANANTISDMHVDSDDYSILQVQGPSGLRETTRTAIKAMMGHHPEILSVSRNYIQPALLGSSQSSPSSDTGSTPNDPDFPQQWPLAAMRWTAARQYATRQRHSAYITIVGGGSTPVTTNNELGHYITQYNATSSSGTPVKEPVSGTGAEGDIDSSVTGALTDNGVDIAGAGCLDSRVPCRLIMLDVTGKNGSADNAHIFHAITWAINNQKARGGRGPINLSYGGATFADSTEMQTLGQSALNQGDILIVAAGDKNGEIITLAHPYQPGSVVSVQATANDATNSLVLTEVVGDPAAAPGDTQPALINGQYNDSHLGSSFSAPLWSASIALLISVNPDLTGAKAHAILLSTGTAGSGGAADPSHHVDPTPNWTFVVPALDKAIEQALHTTH
jgi:hypothetical protein